MRLIAVALAGAGLMASPASAQALILHLDETVTVRMDGGKPVVVRTSPAEPMSKFEIYAVWRAESQVVPSGVKTMPPGFIKRGEGPPEAPRPADNQLQITMRHVPGIRSGSPDNTVLLIRNGYDSALRYHAVMHAGARSAATDVCESAPHRLGVEHWPYELDELDLSDLQLVAFDGTIPCA